MNFYTTDEFTSTRIFELDNNTYNKIHDKFAKMVGDKGADKLMWQWKDKTLRELSCNSFVDVLSCIRFMG